MTDTNKSRVFRYERRSKAALRAREAQLCLEQQALLLTKKGKTEPLSISEINCLVAVIKALRELLKEQSNYQVPKMPEEVISEEELNIELNDE